jgi:hypothetical protein
LVKLIPYGDGMENLSEQAYLELLSMSDPSANITSSCNSAKAWVGTYVIGTIKFVRLLATHGLLNHQATLVLAKGLRQHALAEPETYPDRNFEAASDAIAYAHALEECAEISSAIKMSFTLDEQERIDQFSCALERIFDAHGVPINDVPLYPISGA